MNKYTASLLMSMRNQALTRQAGLLASVAPSRTQFI